MVLVRRQARALDGEEKIMTVPEGLFFYEYVLLILGVVLFAVLLIMLVIYTIQKRSLKGLLPFFTLPIVMVGFPGYEKITFDNGVVTIEKLNSELARNPEDATISNELEKALSEVEERPASDPKTNLVIAKGHAGIGDTLKALAYVDKAIQEDSESVEAKKLQKTLSTPGVRVDKLTNEIERKPDDGKLRKDLIRAVWDLENTSKSNTKNIERLIKSYAFLGDTSKVLSYVDSLDNIDPDAKGVTKELRNRFKKITH